jgi:hypothetical protein
LPSRTETEARDAAATEAGRKEKWQHPVDEVHVGLGGTTGLVIGLLDPRHAVLQPTQPS